MNDVPVSPSGPRRGKEGTGMLTMGMFFFRGGQLEVGSGKKAIIVFVPVPLLDGFHKVQQRYLLSNFVQIEAVN